jgi:hypothetical protein
VVQVVVPSILAAQAEGRQRFDVEAETVGEALRALPVADLLLDERGEWSSNLHVYVDETDAAGSAAGFRVVRAAGVESEMELPFAGVHQLCGPMLGGLGRLPLPQRGALGTAFGLSSGAQPDRFLVGLAVLSLLSDTAEERPLLCLVDDAQWLDRSSAQVLAFVARRLLAESVVLLFAEREPGEPGELAGLPDLPLRGLADDSARELLASATSGPLDDRVRDRILTEARGNPLALIELPRDLSPATLAGGFGLPGGRPVPGRIEASFRRRAQQLPGATQRLLLVAAAEPTGEPALLWRAAGMLVSRLRPWAPRRRMACLTSARKLPSATRCCGRRSTAPRIWKNAGARIWRWPWPPMPRPIPTAGPGTAPTRPSRPTRTSPGSWSARPGGPRRAAG